MKWLSIDNALVTSGYAVFDNEKLIDYGTFTIKKTLPIERRLNAIMQEINKIYAEHEDIGKIVFEDIQLEHGNVLTFKKLAYVQSAILLWCFYNEMDYEILMPSVWRKILGGSFGRKREEQKQHAIDLINDKFNVKVDSDTADAICIGLAAIKESKSSEIGFNDE